MKVLVAISSVITVCAATENINALFFLCLRRYYLCRQVLAFQPIHCLMVGCLQQIPCLGKMHTIWINQARSMQEGFWFG
jgi:hypothetical protein